MPRGQLGSVSSLLSCTTAQMSRDQLVLVSSLLSCTATHGACWLNHKGVCMDGSVYAFRSSSGHTSKER